MKKLLPLLLLFTGMVNSQTINIPDQSFRLKLIALGIDTSGDGAIQQSEALTVTSLDIKSSNIASLNGLEFFSNLTSLDCRYNQILSFNATALTNLVTLDCSVNRLTTLLVNGLTQLQTLNCSINRLSTLNLSGLNNLQALLFSSNNLSALNVSGLNSLQSIDLGHNPIASLNAVTGIPTTLKLLGVQGLGLTTLDVSAFSTLETLYCGQNLFTSLNSITGLTPNLKALHCAHNQLTSLDATIFPNLEQLYCGSNQIATLNITGLVHLKEFECRINQLTSLDLTAFPDLERALCNDNLLTTLNVAGLTHLRYLYSYSNPLTLNINGMATIEYLACSYNQIGSLDFSTLTGLQTLQIYGSGSSSSLNLTGLSNLKELNCSSQGLTSLNLTGLTSLETLVCGQNQLTSLDLTGLVNLKKLYCQDNQLSSLDVSGLPNLEILDCSMNYTLTALDVSALPNLTNLYCWTNAITSLDLSNNNNLKLLMCSWNSLTTLNLSNLTQLENLDCTMNALTSLDLSNNPNLIQISCMGNQLSSLSLSTEYLKLRYLEFGQNNLPNVDFSNYTELLSLGVNGTGRTSVDVSNQRKLGAFSCQDNPITTVDISNQLNMSTFHCGSPELISVFMKNGEDEIFDLTASPNLQYVCGDDNQLENIQTVIANLGNTTAVVNSYCSFVPGGNYNTINGASLFDANGNGCDLNDVIQPNIRININDGTNLGAAFTNVNANYAFYTQAGNFDITPEIENPTWFNFSPIAAAVSFANNNNNVSTNNFCIAPIGVHSDLEVVISPIANARPGFDAIYKIVYKNKGNQITSGNITFGYDDAILDYVSATTAPNSQTTGLLTWNYTNLLPFESRTVTVTINVNSPVEVPPVNLNDLLTFTATVSPLTGDENPADNSFTYHQVVVGSYDPNDITCIEGDNVSPTQIGNYLHYAVNFENTGNFQAENIVVKDIIDTDKYDINSLQVLSTSNPAYIKITGNVVEFIFQGINLEAAHGTPPVGGHGDVLFKIKTRSDLQQNDMVLQRAGIYFDYNAPIGTTDAETTFAALNNPIFELDNSIKVYPNPTTSAINVDSEFNINSIELYDVQGRILETHLEDSNTSILDISNKSKGIYFLKIKTEKGSKVEKIVKE
jgi:uncharacterized repeat protein (TIGR01451 family)